MTLPRVWTWRRRRRWRESSMAELTQKMKELVQPYLAEHRALRSNFTPTSINLSANENTYPVPEGVREAIDAALLQRRSTAIPIPCQRPA